jgi:hypothetical protein
MYIKFTRKSQVVEVGSVGIEVEPDDTWEDIAEKAYDEEFAEFLVTDREYINHEWKFSEFDEDEPYEEFELMEETLTSFFDLANDEDFVAAWLEKRRKQKEPDEES